MPIITGTAIAGTLLVGGGVGVAAAAVGTGALYYKWKKMNKRTLAKPATIGLFGSVLDTIDGKYIDPTTGVPHILEDIFRVLEGSALSTPGLFHSPGNINRIKELQILFEEARHDELALVAEDPHDLCAIVVHYLHRLPEPVCTLLLYADFIEGHCKYETDPEGWLEKMRKLFDTLPEMNKRLFIRSLHFFDKVATNEENKVSRAYLVCLLGPLFFYDQTEVETGDPEEAQLTYNRKEVKGLFAELMMRHQELFPLSLEEMPPWRSSRDFDSVSRLKKGKKTHEKSDHPMPSFAPPAEGEATEVASAIPPGMVDSPQTARKRRSKSAIKLTKIKKQYLGNLPQKPPPGTIPVNYVLPEGYSQF